MMTLAEVNAMEKTAFVGCLGGVYEHSPWVAEQVAGARPFLSVEQMLDQMRAAVDGTGAEAQLELIRAHPDLAGKLAMANELTEASRREQGGAGLDRLDKEEFAEFSELNRRYRQRFGFPFVICVRKTDKAGILAAFRKRLENGAEEERTAAVAEIHEIARLRIEDLVPSDQ